MPRLAFVKIRSYAIQYDFCHIFVQHNRPSENTIKRILENFNFYLEFIMRQVVNNWQGGVTTGGARISNLSFTDDTTESHNEMLTLL